MRIPRFVRNVFHPSCLVFWEYRGFVCPCYRRIVNESSGDYSEFCRGGVGRRECYIAAASLVMLIDSATFDIVGHLTGHYSFSSFPPFTTRDGN